MKTILKAIYSAFISVVLISIILSGWTGYAFIFQPKKSGEIINVIQSMYENQKSVILKVIELSNLLIKDTNERIANEDNDLLTELDSLDDTQNNSLVNELSILEDNGDNPLGIVIEPSSSEESEKIIPEMSLKPLDIELSEVPMNEIE
tara:strand:- start:3266 stop:3709 length:444 start_codon:yes stop_codon:yes gene_type:complete